MYLGTANGWLYESHNSGVNWQRLSRPGKRDDLVIDGIFIDPNDSKHMVIGAWVLGYKDGGVYVSNDGGVSWTGEAAMQGQAVLSLASAPSDPKLLVIGTLKGVYRSKDGGLTWMLISPPDSTEIHNVQSIAIDPANPNVIYAGTWHLPWKTTDGGTNWTNMKQGIIEDSDVFSIIVDPKTPQTIYTSACSGIYKSDNGGEMYHKVQGIPTTARRTRVLLQDPGTLTTVYAGTTEGLWRTQDAGKDWARTTDPAVIVNDVYVDRRDSKHVLLATDRGGILASEDGGDSFHASNGGFSARQVTAMKRDTMHAGTIYVGVVNDKELGGVFQSDDGGKGWAQHSKGLEGRDVFSLGQAADGTMIAGTSHGLYRLAADGGWNRATGLVTVSEPAVQPVTPALTRPPAITPRNQFTKKTGLKDSTVESPKQKLTPGQKAAVAMATTATDAKGPSTRGKRAAAAKQPVPKAFDGSVLAVVNVDNSLMAATSEGLMKSVDNGANWMSVGVQGSGDWRYLAAAKTNVVAADLHAMHMSSDSGSTWTEVKVPEKLTQIAAISVEPSGEMWVGGREGIWASSNGGADWTTPKNLYINSVTGIYFDEAADRMLITVSRMNFAFFVQLPDKTVTYADTGWDLRFIRPVGDHLVGATFFDGVVVQPSNAASGQRASR